MNILAMYSNDFGSVESYIRHATSQNNSGSVNVSFIVIISISRI